MKNERPRNPKVLDDCRQQAKDVFHFRELAAKHDFRLRGHRSLSAVKAEVAGSLFMACGLANLGEQVPKAACI